MFSLNIPKSFVKKDKNETFHRNKKDKLIDDKKKVNDKWWGELKMIAHECGIHLCSECYIPSKGFINCHNCCCYKCPNCIEVYKDEKNRFQKEYLINLFRLILKHSICKAKDCCNFRWFPSEIEPIIFDTNTNSFVIHRKVSKGCCFSHSKQIKTDGHLPLETIKSMKKRILSDKWLNRARRGIEYELRPPSR